MSDFGAKLLKPPATGLFTDDCEAYSALSAGTSANAKFRIALVYDTS